MRGTRIEVADLPDDALMLSYALAAGGLSYAVARYVFEIDWSFDPALGLSGVAATVLLVAAVGALSSFDVLTKKPLAILRSQ